MAGGGESVGRTSTSYEVSGGRRRFTVELRSGETTIVSWKKLLKDATRSESNTNGPTTSSAAAAASIQPPLPHPSLESRLAPGQPADNEVKDAPPGNRLNAVIEKIERLYVGKQSDDEEDLNDFPDEDEYDTEDSFIDDTELDEYFQVDNSAIKHDGFFVNRGKLERVEPASPQNVQPKKRRRKDLAKGQNEGDDELNLNKPVKLGKKARNAAGALSVTSHLSHGVALQNVSHEVENISNQLSASEIPIAKKAGNSQNKSEQSPSVFRGDSAQNKDFDQQKISVILSKSLADKLQDGSEISGNSTQRLHDKGSITQERSVVGRSVNISDGADHSVQLRDEKFSVNGSEGKNSVLTMKVPTTQRKEGPSGRPKGTMLEKAIRDLEKIVAESRPPNMDIQDADNLSQGIKRRLPPEIKQKLAKVARLAQASHGKISNELTNRLMSIVGHLIQLRTLKRNLKIMVNMGLSAKQEKDNRVQHIKREVAEMIKQRVPLMKSKVLDVSLQLLEQQAGASDDFQEPSAEEKEAIKRKYSMDVALEDKICDLYDHFIEGLDEDAGPQVRKLYAELAGFWPNGFMDNHGIKRAICRSKDRRKALHVRRKDGEKMRNKSVATKVDDTCRVEPGPTAQAVHIQEKIVVDHSSTSTNKPVSSTAAVNTSIRMPVSSANGSDVDRLKQEKLKGVSADPRAADVLPKKKMKRKLESELGESRFHSEKLTSDQAEEKSKTNKHTTCPPKPNNVQQVEPSNFEQLT